MHGPKMNYRRALAKSVWVFATTFYAATDSGVYFAALALRRLSVASFTSITRSRIAGVGPQLLRIFARSACHATLVKGH